MNVNDYAIADTVFVAFGRHVQFSETLWQYFTLHNSPRFIVFHSGQSRDHACQLSNYKITNYERSTREERIVEVAL